MIDCEVEIFNRFYQRVYNLCSVNRVLSTPIDSYAALPAMCLYEMDNTVDRYRQSSTPRENYNRITYHLEIAAKTKAECRAILRVADEALVQMNFTRVGGQFVPALNNKDVLRYVSRYEALVDTEGNLYRA